MTDVPFPVVHPTSVAWIGTEQMIEVDRVMMDDLGIDLVRMMEGAGRSLAQVAERLVAPTRVVVVAGSGGNGGGGMVAARHLANHGVAVSVVLSRPSDRLTAVPRQQLEILHHMGVPIADPDQANPLIDGADLVIDALLGYSLQGAPRGRAVDLIEAMADRAVVALDVPSGLDTSTGSTPGVHVSALATLTLAAPKIGLRDHASVGRLFVADISVPPRVYDAFDAGPAPVFSPGPILEISAS